MTTTALITGAGGQLGRTLTRHAPENIEPVTLGRAELDITRPDSIATAADVHQPDVIINCAAYTNVNGAETERDAAFAINAAGAGNVAKVAREVNARLIHISTDFVFDGLSGTPYRPDDPTNPVSAYGESKLAGEREVFAQSSNAWIFRAGWLYAPDGANFVTTVIRLCREKDTIGIVADQVGTPTSARGFAATIWRFATGGIEPGIYHWSDTGVASWYDFAVAIQEEALEIGLLTTPKPIKPLQTHEFPTPAKRPPYSVLDKTATWDAIGHRGTHWREALRYALLASNARENNQ